MTTETATMTISKSVGYSGKNAAKSYIAQITGTSKEFIFSRVFIDTECTDKNEMFTARRKGRGTWTEAAALEVGMYERCECGDKSFRVVWVKEGKPVIMTISDDRALKMAILMDEGMTADEARLATKAAPKNDSSAK